MSLDEGSGERVWVVVEEGRWGMGIEVGVVLGMGDVLVDDLLDERMGFVCVGLRKEKKLWDKECLCWII